MLTIQSVISVSSSAGVAALDQICVRAITLCLPVICALFHVAIDGRIVEIHHIPCTKPASYTNLCVHIYVCAHCPLSPSKALLSDTCAAAYLSISTRLELRESLRSSISAVALDRKP
jgi:hypothetical protein